MNKRTVFGEEEKILLKSLVLKNSRIVESKCSDAESVVKKKECWDKITEEFNSCGRFPVNNLPGEDWLLELKNVTEHMGCVDLSDMLIALYRTPLRSHRWYLALFAQLLDICVDNAWLMYRRMNSQGRSETNEEQGVGDTGSNQKGKKNNNTSMLPLKEFRADIAEGQTKKGTARSLFNKKTNRSSTSSPSVSVNDPNDDWESPQNHLSSYANKDPPLDEFVQQVFDTYQEEVDANATIPTDTLTTPEPCNAPQITLAGIVNCIRYAARGDMRMTRTANAQAAVVGVLTLARWIPQYQRIAQERDQLLEHQEKWRLEKAAAQKRIKELEGAVKPETGEQIAVVEVAAPPQVTNEQSSDYESPIRARRSRRNEIPSSASSSIDGITRLRPRTPSPQLAMYRVATGTTPAAMAMAAAFWPSCHDKRSEYFERQARQDFLDESTILQCSLIHWSPVSLVFRT
ncbi:hypothetical protein GE061_004003 [Apolygus lucorum]|uniref:Regulatory protein zeste n=1 Tax=Apolygus lucorum TaxID=248454 RepID=A0A8S9WZT6_APOLU|nr:hypothetical protein GE061_004003 [Apolygus lucorum]